MAPISYSSLCSKFVRMYIRHTLFMLYTVFFIKYKLFKDEVTLSIRDFKAFLVAMTGKKK